MKAEFTTITSNTLAQALYYALQYLLLLFVCSGIKSARSAVAKLQIAQDLYLFNFIKQTWPSALGWAGGIGLLCQTSDTCFLQPGHTPGRAKRQVQF
jgi:hypothetical protein